MKIIKCDVCEIVTDLNYMNKKGKSTYWVGKRLVIMEFKLITPTNLKGAEDMCRNCFFEALKLFWEDYKKTRKDHEKTH